MRCTMKRFLGVSVLGGVLGLACGLGPMLVAQEAGKEAAKTEKGEKKGAKKEAKSDNQLPANYGKIGLTDEQRKKIYAIQDAHEKELKELQKKLADLRAKMQGECEAVLTTKQRELLGEINDNSKKKAAEKKKDGEKKAEEKKAE